MKSDSLIKVTASLLSLSLLASTCFTTVSEAAVNNGIISENPVTVSAEMMQTMKSSTVSMVIDNKAKDVASKADKAGLNKGKTEQKKTTEVRSEETVKAVENVDAKEKIESKAKEVAKTGEADKAQEVVQEQEEKKESKYANKGIATEDVVNIREKANTSCSIEGRLYKGAMCEILSDKDGWVEIKSGGVKGYIKKDLLAIGEEAEKIADQYVTKYAKVNTVTLKVREKASTDSSVLELVGEDEKYKILKEKGDWVKVKIDSETSGYMLKDYVVVKEKFDKAVSMEEIEAEEERKEAEEEAKRAAQNSARASNNRTTSSSRRSTSSSSRRTTTRTYASAGSKTGSSVANYALQFRGNPYVYGGTSLTNGTDCSGFTQSVYRNFGYSIPRDSRSQYAGAGRSVSVSEVQPGDLLFYSSGGRISHVGIYIGGGQIVHASNERDGIKVSPSNYRTPVGARRVIN